MTKKRTIQQVETAKERAVRFLRNVLDEPERADQVADESIRDYADRRKIQIVSNPERLTRGQQGRDVLEVVAYHPNNFPQRKRPAMANTPTKAELQETVNGVGEKVSEMLDPELSREEIVRKAKELDELVNGSDDDEDEDEEDDDDEDEDDE